MKKIRIKLFVLLSILSVNGLKAQTEDRKFSLEQAIEYAYKNSYNIQSAQLDINIAKKKVRETTATGFPQISSSLKYTNFIDLATQLIPAEFFGGDAGTFQEIQFGTKNNVNFDITASQLVFSGEYIVGLQASKAYLNLSKYQLAKSKIELKEQVANAYYIVLIALENKNILDSTLRNINKILFETQEIFKEGFVEDTDVDQLKINVSDLETNIANLNHQIDVSYKFLNFLMGMNLEQNIVLTDNLQTLLEKTDSGILLKSNFDFSSNIDYHILLNQKNIAQLSYKREKSAYLPTISAFLSRQENAMRNKFNFFESDEKWFPTTLGGVQISIPIFNSGVKHFKVQQAKLQLKKLNIAEIQLSESLKLEIQKSRINFNNAFLTHKNKKDNLKLAEKIYHKTTIKYKEGISSSLDLTQSYNQYLNSESQYISSILNLLKTRTALEKILTKN